MFQYHQLFINLESNILKKTIRQSTSVIGYNFNICMNGKAGIQISFVEYSQKSVK